MLATSNRSFVRFTPVAALAAAILAGTSTANADVTAATSSGYGLSANVNLLNLHIGVGPLPVAQGTAPTPYSDSAVAASAAASAGLLGGLSTGVLTSNASSNVNGGVGSRFATASTEVDDLGAGILPGLVTLLSVSADTITSTATVSGDHGALNGSGSFLIEGLSIRLLGNNINVAAAANAAPNTVLLNTLGIRIVVNEQIAGGNGVDSRSMTVNALHISFTNVAGLGSTINGDIIVGHSFAAMTTPTPGAAAVLGLGGLASMRRRRR